LGEPHQTLARQMHELGAGRERDRLRLNGHVDDDFRKVRGLGRAGARRRAQTLLDQRAGFSLPIRWRQRVSDERSNGSLWTKNGRALTSALVT
jgi:hypothetical protein